MRDDLRILTPDALAALANVGLVKRAQREIAAGQGPVVVEADGTVTGTFTDGVVATLPPGRSVKDGRCTCGAPGVCRHRIATVLAYAGVAVVRPPWDIGADELLAWLGARVGAVDAAEARGVDVVLIEEPASASFDGCTVRFLAGAALDHARCDCAAKGCLHVGLAVRAFGRARSGSVRLGPPPQPIGVPAVLERVEAWLRRWLARGLLDAAGLAQEHARLRADLDGLPWLQDVLDELDRQRIAWEDRSTAHRPDTVRQLLVEAHARIRATRAGGDAGVLLGVGEAVEVALSQVRLLSLGARLRAGPEGRTVEVLLWDGASVLSWSVPLPDQVDPGTVQVAGGPLGAVAHGQIVSRHLIRGARRTVTLKRGRETSIVPQRGAWGVVEPPVRVDRFAALLEECAAVPPFLRSRSRTAAVRVVAPAAVESLSWSPGGQVLTARLVDAEGGSIPLERSHDPVAPGAIAALAEVLPHAAWISGWVREAAGRLVLEPLAVATRDGRVVVPDLVAPAPIPPLPLAPDHRLDPIDVALGRLEASLERLAMDGVGSAAEPLADGLRALGLGRLADDRERLERGPDRAEAWLLLATRVALARALLEPERGKSGAAGR